MVYAAGMVPEISDRIVEIDRAMRWGYAIKLGPFELWDALGFPDTAERMHERRRIAAGLRGEHALIRRQSFYRAADATASPERSTSTFTPIATRRSRSAPGFSCSRI